MIITIIISSIIPAQVDFTPRYLREDDTGSWLSDGSAAATVEVHSDPGDQICHMRPKCRKEIKFRPRHRFEAVSSPGCNGTVPSGYSPDGVMTSDDGSSIGLERESQLSRSPFYWHNNNQQQQQDQDHQVGGIVSGNEFILFLLICTANIFGAPSNNSTTNTRITTGWSVWF